VSDYVRDPRYNDDNEVLAWPASREYTAPDAAERDLAAEEAGIRELVKNFGALDPPPPPPLMPTPPEERVRQLEARVAALERALGISDEHTAMLTARVARLEQLLLQALDALRECSNIAVAAAVIEAWKEAREALDRGT
jgi:hypothetical protein